MASFSVRTFGCRANQAEAFAWADGFRGRGLRLEEDWGRSDAVIVNSCTLTGRADRDVRKFIRGVHRANPGTLIVVTGCYAERAPAEIAALPGVATVLPQSAKLGLVERVLALGAGNGPADAEDGPARGDGDMHPVRVPRSGEQAAGAEAFRARGWLKIQDGCDGRCAYCVIPAVRGRSRSVPAAEVAASVKELAGRGFREIVLAGIHLSSYGEDLGPKTSLADLLDEIGPAAGGARLRLSSLDPRRTDGGQPARLAGNEAVAPHFHLSLQHASTRVLRAMGRPVPDGAYDALVDGLARLAPEAALGADLLVGFPGETDGDFETLRTFLDRSALTYAHVFSYSPRPGTSAAARPQLPAAVVTERARTLRRLAANKDLRYRKRFLGRELEAVVIGRTDGGAEVLTGNAIAVRVPACKAPRGGAVRVAVRRILPGRTEGEIVA
jgi:threonylcarbamoyladenosine tRNA methylthiotransferase MtaB